MIGSPIRALKKSPNRLANRSLIGASLPGLLIVSAFLAGCGGGGGGGDEDNVVPAPEITSFTASSDSILQGESSTLIAVFRNGAGSINNGIGAVTSGVPVTVTPLVDTSYTLTVTNSVGLSTSAALDVTVDKFALIVREPEDGQLVSSDLTVFAQVITPLDIAFVTATVEGASVPLTYVDCVQNDCDESGFLGQLDLTDLDRGMHVLIVSAEDIEGDVVSKNVTIVLDDPPIVTIRQPLPLSVARPDLLVDVSCVDDVGDCDLAVLVNQIGPGGSPIASGTNTLMQSINLDQYDGNQITLLFRATDSADQTSAEYREIYVEASDRLITVKDFAGRLLDFDGQQVLVLTAGESGDELSVASVDADTVMAIEVPADRVVDTRASYLTPTGAIYTTQEVGGNVTTSRLYDWRSDDDTLTDLGQPNSVVSLVVSGDYAIYSQGTELWLRQFSTGANTLVSSGAGNINNSVASNGVVAYWAAGTYSIVKYEAGVASTLAEDLAYWNTYPLTDGSRFVYRKHDPCCANQQYAITYHDGTVETLLTNFRGSEVTQGKDYLIADGFVAYTDLGGLNQTHVWTRDPGGSLTQRTFFGSNSYIDELAGNNELMFINAGRRYLSEPDAQYTEVGSDLGISSYEGGTWYVMIGRSLFLVN